MFLYLYLDKHFDDIDIVNIEDDIESITFSENSSVRSIKRVRSDYSTIKSLSWQAFTTK